MCTFSRDCFLAICTLLWIVYLVSSFKSDVRKAFCVYSILISSKSILIWYFLIKGTACLTYHVVHFLGPAVTTATSIIKFFGLEDNRRFWQSNAILQLPVSACQSVCSTNLEFLVFYCIWFYLQLSSLCPDDEILLITATKLIKAITNYHKVKLNVTFHQRDLGAFLFQIEGPRFFTITKVP